MVFPHAPDRYNAPPMDMHQDHAPVANVTEPGVAQSSQAQTTPVVGVFDSGVGGFTVARAILALRPDLNLVYFGDSLNAPYGGRLPEQIALFARNSIEFLRERGIQILAVGCNASNSVLGQGELKSYGVPVFDLVSSTTDWLSSLPEPPARLALVATVATINSRYWQRKLEEALPAMEVLPLAAPEFVPLVEAAQEQPAVIRAVVRQRLKPVLDAGVQHILHGCTHFPLLQDYMSELNPEFLFIDPAQCLAAKLAANLEEAPLSAMPGKLELYSSLPGEAFYRAGERLLGRPIREHTKMYIVNPHED